MAESRGGVARRMKYIAPRCGTAKVSPCRSWASRSKGKLGSNAISVQRIAQAIAPMAIRCTASMRRTTWAENTNSRISASTPSGQTNPISAALMAWLRQNSPA